MRAYHVFFLLVAFVAVSSITATADEGPKTVLWQQTPIPVTLEVGSERRVQFDAPVSVGVPAGLQPVLRTQTVSGSVYLLAHRPFDATRVLVRELDSGHTYLLDVDAGDESIAATPIVVKNRLFRERGDAQSTSTDTPSYVSLTRFAAQELFAPLRLLTPLAGTSRVPLQADRVFLLPDEELEATPLLAWRTGNVFLTAVRIRNLGPEPKVLDPRRLRGAWLAATFQHARLLPSGHEADSTAVYLISAQPFSASF